MSIPIVVLWPRHPKLLVELKTRNGFFSKIYKVRRSLDNDLSTKNVNKGHLSLFAKKTL